MKHTVCLALALCLVLGMAGCSNGAGQGTPTPKPKAEYVYPGEETVMAWSNPAYTDPAYAEGETLSVWVNGKNDPEREYSYSGTIHWVENRGNHIFSLLCLPEDYDGTQTYPLLLMVHGFNSRFQNDYDYFVNYLTDAGYAVLLFDFRGGHESAGLSDGKLSQMSYDTKLSDIRAMVSFAETLPMVDQDNFIFVGHSQGGMMGAITACTEELKDRFNGMLLLAPYVLHCDFLEQFGSLDALPESHTVLYTSVGRDYLYAAIKYEDIIWDKLKEYDRPVKILLGTADELIGEEVMEDLSAAFGGVGYEMVEGGYHDFRDDVLPELMPNTILPFLESLVK